MTKGEFERMEEQLTALREVAGEYGEMVSIWCVIGQMKARVKWWKEHLDLLEEEDKRFRQA